MDVKVKEEFERTTHVKNNDKSKKNILRGKRMWHVMIELYLNQEKDKKNKFL